MSTAQQLREALDVTTARLAEAGIVSASAEARALLQHAAGTQRHLLLLDDLPEDFAARLDQVTARRIRREPLQLILGRAPFRRLSLVVRPGVFIPRPETELMVDLLREHHEGPLQRVADLCTGSGAIAAALLDEIPAVQVVAVERDRTALEVAQENLAAGIAADRCVLQAADVTDAAALAPLGTPALDALLSNPPYIPEAAVPRDPEVRDHDPEAALYGGGVDGLEVPRAIIARAGELLRPGGLLVMEHAEVQGAATRTLARADGRFTRVHTARDLTGRDRFLVARREGVVSSPTEVRD